MAAAPRRTDRRERIDAHLPAQAEGDRLDRAIRALIAEHGITISVRAARHLVEEGAVVIGGDVADRPSMRVRGGEHVVAHVPRPEEKAPAPRWTLPPDAVLYEDDFIVAVNKPVRLPTHVTRNPDRDHLLAAASRFMEARDGAAPELFAIHRLDADTSGVIVLSKHPTANGALARAFEQRLVEKFYDAVVYTGDLVHPLDDRFTIECYLRAKGRRCEVVRSGGRSSKTEFEVKRRGADVCMLEARPLTGRMHQLRVQLAHGGTPIFGDHLYGVRRAHAERLLLHARRLTLPHPDDGRPLTIEAPTPDTFFAAFEA